MSLDSDQLIVMESDEVASVCATISDVPGGGLDCPIILSLSAATGNNFKTGNSRMKMLYMKAIATTRLCVNWSN